MEHECETETEEQEEYTAIYTVSRRTHTRTRGKCSRTKSGKNEQSQAKKNLNVFLEGHLPPVIFSPRNQSEPPKTSSGKTDITKENWRNLDIFPIAQKKVFLGECSDQEDLNECPVSESVLTVLKTVRIWKLKKTGKRGYDKFRRTAEFVQFARKICTCRPNRTLSQEESILFFLNTSSKRRPDTPNSPDPRVLFDVTPFKALGQKNFVNTVRNCLGIPPEWRSNDDITAMTLMLRKFSKFCSYPKHVQQGLCQQGWYSRFDKASILAREGSRADFYYLVLSGVAISRCLDYKEDPAAKRSQFVEFHRQGDVIGEKEILTSSERPMTIVCKEPVEVIGLDKEEFLRLFQSTAAPQCISFLNTIPELSGFPFQLLQTYHFSCSVHHYRRGAVIVKDSNESEWIYVIKSGSCQVYESVTRRARERTAVIGPNKALKSSLEGGLPEIDKSIHLVSDACSVSSVEMLGPRKSKSKLANSSLARQKTVLPTINTVNINGSQISPESTPRRCTTSRHGSPRADIRSPRTDVRESSAKGHTYYVKVDIITERECFGLQSLLYKQLPSLSLVSNGAECILLSKQFFRDHMDDDLKRRLVYRVPPYPSNSHVRDAVEDKLHWDIYKHQVLHDAMSK
ncbi:cyclic nucleotide-binding domain-containing protein 2-like [Pecten maximus]|uniref:cyclic nucleotide-binding domain-containing protein 2-like n=1 Tax=Pecten maximus TaxID=6579 RepID=UPI001458D427|nr:cyclic nucleotide-binding domain-containing protein 2-like [Pecten maximus]